MTRDIETGVALKIVNLFPEEDDDLPDAYYAVSGDQEDYGYGSKDQADKKLGAMLRKVRFFFLSSAS